MSFNVSEVRLNMAVLSRVQGSKDAFEKVWGIRRNMLLATEFVKFVRLSRYFVVISFCFRFFVAES